MYKPRLKYLQVTCLEINIKYNYLCFTSIHDIYQNLKQLSSLWMGIKSGWNKFNKTCPPITHRVLETDVDRYKM